MSSDPVLAVSGLCKNFKIYPRIRHRLLEVLRRRKLHRSFSALSQISFQLARGEALGILGQNGSGKSTLLKLIAGILIPDAGTIRICGSAIGLLELGTGFNPELSGRRNIYLNGVYLNLNRAQLRAHEDEIIDFAELGEFIDAPLKTYSSGMAMRLGFAIAIHANPACFILDEALSVGDVRFQQKCFARMNSFRKNGGSILFVSHDLNAIRLFCDRALLLDAGRAVYLGEPETAVNQYNEILAARGNSGQATATGYGNGAVRFTKVEILNEHGRPVSAFVSGRPARIRFEYAAREKVADAVFGVMLRDRFGQDIFGTNGALLNKTALADGRGQGCFVFEHLNLAPGLYSVNLAAHTGATHLENCFHWWDNAASFEILEDCHYRFGGVARLQARLELQ